MDAITSHLNSWLDYFFILLDPARLVSLGLQPLSRYSESCSGRSIGPPPDWGMDMGARPPILLVV